VDENQVIDCILDKKQQFPQKNPLKPILNEDVKFSVVEKQYVSLQ
jgi:hypothetical protein